MNVAGVSLLSSLMPSASDPAARAPVSDDVAAAFAAMLSGFGRPAAPSVAPAGKSDVAEDGVQGEQKGADPDQDGKDDTGRKNDLGLAIPIAMPIPVVLLSPAEVEAAPIETGGAIAAQPARVLLPQDDEGGDRGSATPLETAPPVGSPGHAGPFDLVQESLPASTAAQSPRPTSLEQGSPEQSRRVQGDEVHPEDPASARPPTAAPVAMRLAPGETKELNTPQPPAAETHETPASEQAGGKAQAASAAPDPATPTSVILASRANARPDRARPTERSQAVPQLPALRVASDQPMTAAAPAASVTASAVSDREGVQPVRSVEQPNPSGVSQPSRTDLPTSTARPAAAAAAPPVLSEAKPDREVAPSRSDKTDKTEKAVGPAEAQPVPSDKPQALAANAPVALRSAPAATPPQAGAALAAGAADRQLDLARTNAWLDGIAHDIARTGDASAPLRFEVGTERLGAVKVELHHAAEGATVTFTAAGDAARTVLSDVRHQLIADARAQGVQIAAAHVSAVSDAGNAGTGMADRHHADPNAAPAPPQDSGRSDAGGFFTPSGGGGFGQAGGGGDAGRHAQARQQAQPQPLPRAARSAPSVSAAAPPARRSTDARYA